MHAASVHPEPGSNSLKNGYIQLFRAAHTYFLELAYLSFLLLFRVFQSDFDEIPSHTRISISICVQNPVVQFSMTKFVAPLGSATFLLYNIRFRLSSVFWKFFKKFSKRLFFGRILCRVYHSLTIIQYPKAIVNTFLKVFYDFFKIFLSTLHKECA